MKLEQGKEYTLKYTGQFCHAKGGLKSTDFPLKAIFVGEISIGQLKRNIFYGPNNTYMMFDVYPLDYIVRKPTQKELHDKVLDESGVNIVTCGNCGKVMLHDFDDEEVECPHCEFQSEPCDFPDLITD